MVITSVPLGFLIRVPSPQSQWPLGLGSDLLCCLHFLQGFLSSSAERNSPAMKIIRMLTSAETRYIVVRAMACSCSLLGSPMGLPKSGQAASVRTLSCDCRECCFVCAITAGFYPVRLCPEPVGAETPYISRLCIALDIVRTCCLWGSPRQWN